MYLVIGGNGYLGSYILKNIIENTNDSVVATARDISCAIDYGERVSWRALDVTDFPAVDDLSAELEADRPNLKIVYLAAYHHPDKVEKNPALAWHINIAALAYFIDQFKDVCRFVYPSTDSVYGESGADELLSESSPLHPVNLYGKHKAAAEAIVTSCGYHVVRYPFLIGPSRLPFKKHFYDEILSTISDGRPMEMFADSYRSSLDFNTVASLTVRLMEMDGGDVPQILNVSGDDKLSKYDVGRMIAEKHHIDTSQIVPISAKGKNSIFEAKRANATLLDNSLLKRTLHLREVKIRI